tara:strand:+ start:5220 stop:6155 length:936 start_codon:yes stop_codon:yes gene_type:complete
MEIIKTVPENFSKTRLDKVCSEIFDDFSRSQLKKWILEGRILLNNEIALPKDHVNKNDEISLNPESENKISWQAEDISFEVIFENEDYLIINKPFNLVMHPGAGCNKGTFANGLLFHYPELKTIPRAGIVHRLDKDTSGILLVARTEKFRNYFVQLLQERKVKKLYKAVVVGKTIGSFEISEPIGRDRNNRTKMSIRSDGKEALTFAKLNENLNNYSLLDVRIETGRTHQIRVHLSSKKLPIIGDKTYNPSNNIAKETPKELIEIIRTFPRQALHSYKLSFMGMDSDEMMSFVAPLPDDIQKLIKTLKKHT